MGMSLSNEPMRSNSESVIIYVYRYKQLMNSLSHQK